MSNLPINLPGLIEAYTSFPVDFGRSVAAGTSERLWLRRMGDVSEACEGVIRESGGFNNAFTIPAGTSELDAVFTLPYTATSVFSIEITSTPTTTLGLNLSGYLQLPTLGAGITPDPTGRDLTTLSSVKLFLKTPDASQDTYLQLLITRVSEAMQVWMGRDINTVARTSERLNSTGLDYVILGHWPVQTVTKVVENGDTLDVTDYYVNTSTGELTRLVSGYAAPWRTGKGQIEVDYTSGHTTTPPDLQQAADQEVARAFQASHQGAGRNALQGSTLTTGGQSSFLTGDWLPETRSVMDRYRRVDVAI